MSSPMRPTSIPPIMTGVQRNMGGSSYPHSAVEMGFTLAKSDEWKYDLENLSLRKAELGHSGVGIKLGDGPGGWPVVHEISVGGSMHRDGTIFIGALITRVDGRDTRGLSLQDVTSSITGATGTMVSLGLMDHLGGATRHVTLTRGSREYWKVCDEMERARKDLQEAIVQQSSMKHVTSALKADLGIVTEQLTTADHKNEKLEKMIHEESRRVYAAETELSTIRQEKVYLEANMEQLLDKLVSHTCNLKAAEGVARAMVVRATTAEKARANEEQVRKMAEEREQRLKEELLESARRHSKSTARALELERQVSNLDAELKIKENFEGVFGRLYQDLAGARKAAAAAVTDRMEALSDRERALAREGDLVKQVGSLERLLEAANETVLSLRAQSIAAHGAPTPLPLPVVVERDENLQQQFDDAAVRAGDAERAAEVLREEVVQLKAEVREHAGRLKEVREAVKASEAALTHERYEAERGRRELEEQIRVAQAAAKETSAKHALVLKTSVSLMRQVEEMRVELDRTSGAVRSGVDTKDLHDEAERSKVELGLSRAQLEVAERRAKVSEAEAASLRDAKEALERRLNEAPSGPGFRLATAAGGVGGGEGGRQAAEELGIAKVRAEVARRETLTVKNALDLAREREEKLAQQILQADEAIRGLEAQCASLQEKLAGVTEVYRNSCAMSDMVHLAARCEGAEKKAVSLEAETRRALEGEATARAELEALVAEHNGLVQATSEESTRVRSQARLRETRALSKVNVLQEQVLSLERELAFFKSLPESVGVGLELKELVLRTTSTMQRVYEVVRLAQGMSAAMSEALRIGDRLVEVDGTPCADLTFQQIQDRMRGKRGSQIQLALERSGAGGRNDTVNLKLKRGGYGPDHAVVWFDLAKRDLPGEGTGSAVPGNGFKRVHM